eukprot:265325_1
MSNVSSSNKLSNTDKIIKQGYLQKQSKTVKQFRKRWMVLKKNALYSYKNKRITDKNPTELFDLTIYNKTKLTNKTQFELLSTTQSRLFIAESSQDVMVWISFINSVQKTLAIKMDYNESDSAIIIDKTDTIVSSDNDNEDIMDQLKTFGYTEEEINVAMKHFSGTYYDINDIYEHIKLQKIVRPRMQVMVSTMKNEIIETFSDIIIAPDEKQDSELIVTLSAGRNLPAMDYSGKSDCYVKVSIGNICHKSKVITSLNPIWNDIFIFNMRNVRYCNYLIIEVFDQDTVTSDDDIGVIMIHFLDIHKYCNEFQWIALQRKSNNLKAENICGEIQIKCEIKNVMFKHKELYQYKYETVLLPLTRDLSLNSKLLICSNNNNNNNNNNDRKLKKYVGFNA